MVSKLKKQPESGLYGPVWAEWNKLIDYVREITPQRGRGMLLTRKSNGTTISIDPAQADQSEPGVITQYRVKSVADDWLVCREFNGTSESGSDVIVAKPYNLRKTGWDGVTVTYTIPPYPGAPASITLTYSYVTPIYRTATSVAGGVSGTEHQVIIPYYVPNKSVIFGSGSSNGTGVSSAEVVDLNVDGRDWCRVL